MFLGLFVLAVFLKKFGNCNESFDSLQLPFFVLMCLGSCVFLGLCVFLCLLNLFVLSKNAHAESV